MPTRTACTIVYFRIHEFRPLLCRSSMRNSSGAQTSCRCLAAGGKCLPQMGLRHFRVTPVGPLISICNVVTIEEQPYTQNLMILPVFDSRIPVTATHLMRMRLLRDYSFIFLTSLNVNTHVLSGVRYTLGAHGPALDYWSFNSSLSLIPPSPA